MARPRVAAGALIRNDAGEILLVKPTYKEGWEIPGGYVEPGESPKAACEREIREELGVDLTVGDLLVVDWAPSESDGDKLLFVFDCDLPDGTNIRLPPEELSDAQFHPAATLATVLPGRLERRLTSSLILSTPGAIYLEHGRPPAEIVARAENRPRPQ